MRIGSSEIGGERAWIAAEIGSNHQGSPETAEKLIRAAAAAGADAVKFQKRCNRSLYTQAFYDHAYESENAYGPTYGLHREALELPARDYVRLKDVAGEVGVEFFATAFDFPSMDFLGELGVPAVKIASGSLTNIPLIEYASSFGVPLIISTGGGTWSDVARAVEHASPADVALLQCTAAYPAQHEDLNLRVIQSYAEDFAHCVPGVSLHTSGIAMAPVAYVLGARVIEFHLTLNRASRGTDHAFSLEPQGFAKMVRDVRRAEVALGSADKRPLPCEAEPILKMSSSLYLAEPMRLGDVIECTHLRIRSPGGGIPPSRLADVVGRRVVRDLPAEHRLELPDLLIGNQAQTMTSTR